MDDCSGQNNDYTLVLLLSYLSNITGREIEIIYPERDTLSHIGQVVWKRKKNYDGQANYDRSRNTRISSRKSVMKSNKGRFRFLKIKQPFPGKKSIHFKLSKVRILYFSGKLIKYSNNYEQLTKELILTKKDTDIYDIQRIEK